MHSVICQYDGRSYSYSLLYKHDFHIGKPFCLSYFSVFCTLHQSAGAFCCLSAGLYLHNVNLSFYWNVYSSTALDECIYSLGVRDHRGMREWFNTGQRAAAWRRVRGGSAGLDRPWGLPVRWHAGQGLAGGAASGRAARASPDSRPLGQTAGRCIAERGD
jgi:hypothetical protein